MLTLASRPPGADALLLDDVLDLHAVRPLAENLLARRGRDQELDASEVRRLGGLCLQVLLAAHDGWVEDGKSLTILNSSTAFVEGLARLGAAPDA